MAMMARERLVAVFLALAVLLLAGVPARAGEKDDAALAKAPAVVRETVTRALAGRKMAEFGRERIGKTVVYEIGFKVDGVDHALNVSEAGELLFEEADVEVAKVPAAVTDAVKATQPKGKIVEAAMATAGEKRFYLIDVKVDGATHAVQVSLEGKVIADEVVTKLPAEGAVDGK
jgi:hypothetical protein